MPIPSLRLDEDAPELEAGLARTREELQVPGPHGAAAVAEAEAAAHAVLSGLEASLPLGETIAVRIDDVDMAARRVTFTPV